MKCSRGGKSCLQVFSPVSGAMSTTSTLAVIHDTATMGLHITGLVRPAGVSEVIFCFVVQMKLPIICDPPKLFNKGMPCEQGLDVY